MESKTEGDWRKELKWSTITAKKIEMSEEMEIFPVGFVEKFTARVEKESFERGQKSVVDELSPMVKEILRDLKERYPTK